MATKPRPRSESGGRGEILPASVRYQAAFLQSPTATALYDVDGYLVDANPAWLALFGWPDLGSLLGQPLRLTAHAGPHAADLPEPGQVIAYRTRLAAAPGAHPALAAADSTDRPGQPPHTWVDLRLVAISGNHGAGAGYQVEATDVTAAVRADHELRREHARLATVISSVRVGTWERDLVNGELVVNERWAGILGYRLSELTPVSVDWLVANAHPDDWEAAEAKLLRHLRGDTDQYDAEFRVRHRAGHWVWVRDRGSVTQHADDGRAVAVDGAEGALAIEGIGRPVLFAQLHGIGQRGSSLPLQPEDHADFGLHFNPVAGQRPDVGPGPMLGTQVQGSAHHLVHFNKHQARPLYPRQAGRPGRARLDEALL